MKRRGIFCFRVLLVAFAIQAFASCDEPSESRQKRIKLTHIPGFLSSEQCEHLINSAQNKFVRSPVVTGVTTETSDQRTSSTHFFNKAQDDVIKAIELKAAQYVHRPVDKLESLQIVRYLPGQQFKEHHDWFQREYVQKNGLQREFTIFVYLNDVTDGGETTFPHLNIEFKPKEGDAVFWENCSSPTTCHDDALHQGKPPVQGTKYGLNIWVQF